MFPTSVTTGSINPYALLEQLRIAQIGTGCADHTLNLLLNVLQWLTFGTGVVLGEIGR